MVTKMTKTKMKMAKNTEIKSNLCDDDDFDYDEFLDELLYIIEHS